MKVKTLKRVLKYYLTSDDPIITRGYSWRIWMCSRAINRYIREFVQCNTR